MSDIQNYIQKLGDDTLSIEEQAAALQQIEQSLLESQSKQEEIVQSSTDLVVEAIKTIEDTVYTQFKELSTSESMKGPKGDRGLDGKNGKDGKDGIGRDGRDGKDGKDGIDGEDGRYITDIEVDIDDTLLVTLSDNTTLKTSKDIKGPKGDQGPQGLRGSNGNGVVVGGSTGQVLAKASNIDYDVTWVAASTGSGTVTSVAATAGTGISITGSPITSSGTLNITNTAPDQTVVLNAGTGISTSGTYPNFTITNTSPSSGGTVTSVGGTGTVSGISLSGTVTSSGNLTLGGTLDLSSPPAIGGTTPAAGTFTTITGQTEILKGTGINLFTYSQPTNTGWVKSGTATLTENNTTAPDGTSTAALVSCPAAGDYIYETPATYVGIAYTFSYYIKNSTAVNSYAQIRTASTAISVNIAWSAGVPTPTVVGGTGTTSATSVGSGWYRISINYVSVEANARHRIYGSDNVSTAGNIYVWGIQLEIGSVANTYIPTTTTAVYGTPTLSFSGVAGLGLQSDGSLYVSPAGTGALQAQATTSSTVGGNARGINATDWQTNRTSAATRVAGGGYSVLSGGTNNSATAYASTTVGGEGNQATSNYTAIGGGSGNTASGQYSTVSGGRFNTTAGYLNYVGGGFTNSGTANAAVTTQVTTIAVTAGTTFYLTSTNANIKIGQYITGTGISADTYATSAVTTGTPAVMATSTISGTTLTVGSLSSGTIVAGQVLTGTGITAGTYIVSGSGSSWTVSTSQTVASTTITGTAYTFTISQAATTSAGVTLSFYTPHGVVVGGGNNQATGAYSFIGGGGDAGTAANRNTASGDWSVVTGGIKNVASGIASFIGGGGTDGTNILSNQATGTGASVIGGASCVSGGSYAITGGRNNTADGNRSTAFGAFATTRGLTGNIALSACNTPIAATLGVSQSALLVLARQTTDATATVITSDTGAASGTNQVILPNNSAYYFKARVIAGVTGAGNTKAWTLEGAIKRGSGVGTTAIVGTVTTTVVATDAGAATWTVTATADTTNGGLAITVTGQASTTIRWVCKVETAEMTY